MSVRYAPVGWSRFKAIYDSVLVGGVVAYLLAYLRLAPLLQPGQPSPDGPTLAMRAFGTCAFLMLSLVLCIGPLCRLDRRMLPLLYNRRHFGVLTCAVASGHSIQVLGWYFAAGKWPMAEALLGADTSFGQVHGFPFIPFGIAALLILCALAFTSHDFWLSFLSPPVWKTLHMAVYAAYALVVLHIAMGALQGTENPMLGMLVAGSVVLVCTLHVAAGLAERRRDGNLAAPGEPPWLDAAAIETIPEGGGVVVRPTDGEAVAIFRNQGRLSAVSNLCAHQNGPLGEGRVLDGCITCPWHGFQYRLEDGCAPPPFTEKLATYRLRIEGGRVWLDPRANPPGTFVAPVPVAGAAA
jgi:nitrite reductase/ring-hydroxylating ferredoxin subunit/DMSO/TMAO reductase YedYZ heme-binding membrane subunit